MAETGYITLSKQSGLLRAMDLVAQNIANASTDGYRAQGLLFSEHVAATGRDSPSLSMAHASVRLPDETQGALAKTGGTYDFAIQGEGYFQLETANGPVLTRAGAFTPNADGELVAHDGARLLDAGGAAVQVPPVARTIALSEDGTLSADGLPVAKIGLFAPADPTDMTRLPAARFRTPDTVPAEGSALLQGFIERANVDPVTEIARMIEVQHAYQLGQGFLDREDERIRGVIQTLGR